MWQQITLAGNLGGDPEMRYTQDGDAGDFVQGSYEPPLERPGTGRHRRRRSGSVFRRGDGWRRRATSTWRRGSGCWLSVRWRSRARGPTRRGTRALRWRCGRGM